MEEPVDVLAASVGAVASQAADFAIRSRVLVTELSSYLDRIETAKPAESTGVLDAASYVHAQNLLRNACRNVVPLLDYLAHISDTQRGRTMECAAAVAHDASLYARAATTRQLRSERKSLQVLDIGDINCVIAEYGRVISDVVRHMEHLPISITSAVAAGSLGATEPGRIMSRALQERIFDWSVQREARRLADAELASCAPLGCTGNESGLAATTAVGRLQSLIDKRREEHAALAAQLEDEQQLLINEQAFVDNLLADVDTLEGALEAVRKKADVARLSITSSFQTLESELAHEGEQAVKKLRQERDRLLTCIRETNSNATRLEEEFEKMYQDHPAHGRIRALQQQHLQPTLRMLEFAVAERKRRSLSSSVGDLNNVRLADEVNDPVTRMWLRGELPPSHALPPVLILQDMDTGAFVRCVRHGSETRADLHPSEPSTFTLRHRDALPTKIRLAFVR